LKESVFGVSLVTNTPHKLCVDSWWYWAVPANCTNTSRNNANHSEAQWYLYIPPSIVLTFLCITLTGRIHVLWTVLRKKDPLLPETALKLGLSSKNEACLLRGKKWMSLRYCKYELHSPTAKAPFQSPSAWHWWCTQWQFDMFSSQYFGCLLSGPFPPTLSTHLHVRVATTGRTSGRRLPTATLVRTSGSIA
jgi:hypothetical protein